MDMETKVVTTRVGTVMKCGSNPPRLADNTVLLLSFGDTDSSQTVGAGKMTTLHLVEEAAGGIRSITTSRRNHAQSRIEAVVGGKSAIC